MSPTNELLVDIRNLQFRYPGTNSLVLDIAEFSLRQREKIFVHGPSGSGKTTFLEILAGMLPTPVGQVTVAGNSLQSMGERARDRFRGEKIGFIFQSLNLIPYLNVEENILLPFRLFRRSGFSSADIHGDLQRLTDRLGISSLLKRNVGQLSVGQQQRVAVARAFITRPLLLLADEPTSALDTDRREGFMELLFDLSQKEQMGVIFVSHDHSLKNRFDRCLELRDLSHVSPAQAEAP